MLEIFIQNRNKKNYVLDEGNILNGIAFLGVILYCFLLLHDVVWHIETKL